MGAKNRGPRPKPDPGSDLLNDLKSAFTWRGDRWLTARTPPDYQDRNRQLGLRRDLLPSTARVLFVDD